MTRQDVYVVGGAVVFIMAAAIFGAIFGWASAPTPSEALSRRESEIAALRQNVLGLQNTIEQREQLAMERRANMATHYYTCDEDGELVEVEMPDEEMPD
jgi:YD repeat-containing protein